MQALQKRALPRALMSDNGSAMTSAEFTEGLARLGILHQPTLPYSPYQYVALKIMWRNASRLVNTAILSQYYATYTNGLQSA